MALDTEEILKRIKKIQRDIIMIERQYDKEMSVVWEDLNKLKKDLI